MSASRIFPTLILCLLTLAARASGTECYKFNRIKAGQGLSNSEILCIFKDRTGFVWFGTPSGLNRYDGYEIVSVKQNISDRQGNTSNNHIEKIQEAFDGKLWIKTRTGYAVYDPSLEIFIDDVRELFLKYAGTEQFGSDSESVMYIDRNSDFWFVLDREVRKYDVAHSRLTTFRQETTDGLSAGNIRDIRSGQNRYWFIFDDGRIECMEAQTGKVISRDSTLYHDAKVRNDRDVKLFVDSSGDLWAYGLGTSYGAGFYDIARNVWKRFSTVSQGNLHLPVDVVSSISEDSKGMIWIGTDHGGVVIFDKSSGSITEIKNDEKDPHSLAQNTVRTIYCDDSGIVWLGTYKNGVCYYHESIYKFSIKPEISEIPFRDVNSFCESPDANLWIGTNGGGLLYFDRKEHTYKSFRHSSANGNTPAGDVIVSLATDPDNKLWIGYYLNGMDCYDGKTFHHYESEETQLADNNAWVLKIDRAGNLWVGTLHGGVFVFDTRTGKRIRRFPLTGSVYAIVETKSGDILIGGQSGIYIYNKEGNRLDPYEEKIFTGINLSRHDINCMIEDSRGLIWIGTKTGMFIFNPYTKDIRNFSGGSGLPSDLVQSIVEDSSHNIWAATNSGLTNIRVYTDSSPGYMYTIVNYDGTEGLQGEMFNYNAAFLTSRSELVFGGPSGYNIFTPSEISYNTNIPGIVFTGFQIYNRRIRPMEKYHGRIILKESIAHTTEINLSHSDNYFTLNFATLDYCMPGKSKCYYRLEGFNNQWLEGLGTHQLTYTNLNPGHYTLYIKAVNNDGVESIAPAVLRINVYPPFYRTGWAFILYSFIGISFGAYSWYRISKRSRMKIAGERESLMVNQRLEMEEMKLRFFTNISHEFRTPLTLILSPLEDLLRKAVNEEDRELLLIIRRNAQSLLSLVSQLLDFRKLDVNVHTLQKSLGDIVLFVRQQADLFVGIMARKEISFTFRSEIDRLYMYFDADKLSKVITNLLSNAFKFTPSTGEISIEIIPDGTDHIRIIISDTGIGIPESELDRIFDRFYQVPQSGSIHYQGSGIGLHISKEFVTLHEGVIWAESKLGEGSRFIVSLPLKDEEESTVTESESEDAPPENTLPKLLIVEDNRELILLLASRLKENYTILQAGNGIEGLATAIREIPDIILSDIMMPKMDGIEMSRKLRKDIRTSHIPIILLTARSGNESQLEGLAAGADDCITKPFNHELLRIKLHNLLETRRRNQQLLKEQIRIEPSRITVNSLDEQLIRKAITYVETHLDDPALSVEELSRELGMSRVHLYKKLSSISGKTPTGFIRLIRLKRAAQLLEESQLTISEIAYEVGFNHPKYFRKYFRDEYGVLPSQYGGRGESGGRMEN
jgi:signal transduction histidine kinase/ligand-binding sensor domain-containing protein/DNA-binding response OmpR family regulator